MKIDNFETTGLILVKNFFSVINTLFQSTSKIGVKNVHYAQSCRAIIEVIAQKIVQKKTQFPMATTLIEHIFFKR